MNTNDKSKDKKVAGRIFDTVTLRRLYGFVKPYQGKFYGLILLTIVLGVLAPLRVLLIQDTVDKNIANGDFPGLVRMTIYLIVLLVVQSVGQYIYSYTSGWMGQTIIRDIRVRLYAHVLQLRLRFFDNNQVGRLITRNISDVETLSDVFTEGLAAMAGDLLQLGFILGFMFYTDWRLTLISLSVFPVLLVSTYIFKEQLKKTFNDVRAAVANLNTFVQEHITGMNIVQLFSAEDREFRKFDAINVQHKKANIRSVLIYAIYFPVAEVVGAAGTGLLVWYGAREVIHEQVTLGVLIAFIMYIGMFFRPIRTIADRFNTLQLGIVSADRILNLLDNQDATVRDGDLEPVILRGAVTFENVWFAYKDEDYILKDISLSVKPGETIALVGATGAGKSSIINLLNRFYDINKGRILVDGYPIEQYELDYLRGHIGVVLQDVFLFSGSVRDNITLYNPNIDDAQIMRAAEAVGALPFLQKLPGGLDYDVMERGATLSVGQRQLVSFIRTMVYNPSILVLDEATSSVDTETESLIQEALGHMMKGRTSIVIAHRLSTIQQADVIMVMDKGEIKERGTHEQLLALGGFYAQLHAMQYKDILVS
jgi:ATP-binding cassette subfamily B protein